jgi:tetratricopeptide (TPR) repeat protein
MKRIVFSLIILAVLLVLGFFLFHGKLSENANQKGIEFYNTGDFEQAMEAFKKAARFDKTNSHARINLVKTFLILKKFDHAESQLDLMDIAFTENAEILGLRGQLLTLEEKYEDAVKMLNRSIDLRNDLAFVYYYRGIAKANLDDLKGAADDYRRSQELDATNIDALEQRAIVLSQLSDFNEGIKNYNKLIELDPSNTEAYLNRGNFKMEIGDNQGAIRDYDNALKLNTKLGEAYFNRGKCYADLEEYSGALADFLNSEKHDFKQAASLYNAGLAELKLNHPGKAEEYLKLTIKYDRNNQYLANAYQLLGVIRMMSADYPAAIQNFSKTLALNDAHAEAYYNRGVTYGLTGEYLKAVGDLEKSRKLGKNNADVFFALGVNKISLNNFDGGCADLKKSEEMGHSQAGQMRLQYCKNYP